MLKKITLILLVLFSLLITIINFSEVTTSYSCNGEMKGKDDNTEKMKLFMKLNDYRWWVHLWSKSDGNLHVEIPNYGFGVSEYYGNVEKLSERYIFSDLNNKPVGYFSLLSKTLLIFINKESFKGECELIENVKN
jgi:hypothetical protein